ncbi:hypothetical protein IEQ34_015135 [Dendrobium chrysotoxum]|uniref:Homeobox domain-containing protein n=1 Tax=Dendrobium chrysotoxum TaxID=161865 RepID=A0AAV7GNF0_DENCH|nr:hypothetical protein IEQ34_015135 [Dendrobium chrysotoxum]
MAFGVDSLEVSRFMVDALLATIGEVEGLDEMDGTGFEESAPNVMLTSRAAAMASVSIPRTWLFKNFLHQYLNDVDKHILARQTGLSRSQVYNWFINAKVRLWKPMIEEMFFSAHYSGYDLIFTVGVSDFMKDWFFAENSYSSTNWQIKFKVDYFNQNESYMLQITIASATLYEILVQFNDSKAEPPHLDWGKPLHVVILKSTFKVFDPGICLGCPPLPPSQ